MSNLRDAPCAQRRIYAKQTTTSHRLVPPAGVDFSRNIAKLERFKGQTPYEVRGNGKTTRLKFLKADPLPLVSVRVTRGDEVTFYSSGAGIGIRLILCCFLGLRQEKSALVLDPATPPSLDGLRVELEMARHFFEVTYRVESVGSGPPP